MFPRLVAAMRAGWPALFLAFPLVWLFRRALWADEVFAFRDAAHYYFPLYRYVQQQWQQGWPLWNPLDHYGQPLWGDPTAAVLYPGKVIFGLPLPYATCFALYVVLHLWCGGVGAYALARAQRANVMGALVAGLAFELSGQVLFQYCNPIYAVGAAWLPWAMRALTCDLVRPTTRSFATLCAFLSLMVLGGDPHTAYYVLLSGVVFRLVACRLRWQWACLKGVARLAGQGTLVLCLCAVQVLPTLEWVRGSDRALREGPRSVFELTSDVWTATRTGSSVQWERLWRRPPASSHDDRIYDFSVGPWRLAELVWPQCSGSPFPVHRRWLAGFPGVSRMWTPSLYLGLLPFLLACSRVRLWRGPRRVRWWSWLTLLAILAACGKFGGGWLVNEFRYLWNPAGYEEAEWLPGLGGLYWFMNMVLPGHVGFRYPAKLWTLASLGLAVLAAQGCRPWQWPRLGQHRVLVGVAILSGSAAVVLSLWGVPSAWQAWPASRIFGPLDASGAWSDLVRACIHAAVVSAAALGVLRLPIAWRGIALCLLTCGELVVAQANLVQTVSSVAFQDDRSWSAHDTLFRCRPVDAYPQLWQQQSDPERFAQLQTLDVQTLMPKHHLPLGVRSLLSSAPMRCGDYAMLWQLEPDGERRPSLKLLTLLNAQHAVMPPPPVARSLVSTTWSDSALVHTRLPSQPPAWLCYQWRRWQSPSLATRPAVLSHTREVLMRDAEYRDIRLEAQVEGDVPPSPSSPPRPAESDRCQIVSVGNGYCGIRVRNASDAVLTLAAQYFPGWEVRVATGNGNAERRNLLRVNRVMRGVFLPAGEHHVEFHYRPRSVLWGCALSGISWAGLLAAVAGARLNLRRRFGW